MHHNEIMLNGWTAVPLDANMLFSGKTYLNAPTALKTNDIAFPSDDAVVIKAQQYAKEKLSLETYNHSMRVYYYATAIIRQQFAQYADCLSPSTLALTCLLHDIGTADENLAATRMSFEFYGGIKALNVLHTFGSVQDQRDAVCETIIRHQDLGNSGNITFLGQVIQLATIFDNVTSHPRLPNIKDLIHVETRENVIQAYPRTGWLGCFARTVQKEVQLKPWSHTTHIPNFGEKILGNSVMAQYE
ncbi:hypothetical protein K4F52_000302 [Lecanicillium sp. MT-2017a]|nr:hypothetical protein K4F52_000302 [Lecanicillium sp. MT-2017a]